MLNYFIIKFKLSYLPYFDIIALKTYFRMTGYMTCTNVTSNTSNVDMAHFHLFRIEKINVLPQTRTTSL